MTENKIYTREEMREQRIFTGDYAFIGEAGEYIATLEMRAEASSGMLRLFFRLVNGSKIITPVFWWQKYLGFYDIDNGTKLKLIYRENPKRHLSECHRNFKLKRGTYNDRQNRKNQHKHTYPL